MPDVRPVGHDRVMPGSAPLRWPVVLFDLDGTLVEPELGITSGIQVALAAVGIDEPDRAALRRYIGPPLQDGFATHHGVGGAHLDLAVATYRAYFDERGYAEVEVHDGIPELLGGLRRAGARLAVATSKPEGRAVRVLEHAGLLEAFEVVAGATDDGRRRHKADVVGNALARLGDGGDVVPGPAVLVGDRDLDAHGARAAGIDAVGVRWGHAEPGELEAARPVAVVATVVELRAVLGLDEP